MHWGLVLGVLACVALGLWLRCTASGFSIRVVGGNPRAAQLVGLPATQLILTACALGGASAGLAGAVSEQLLRRRALADLQRVPEELLAVDAARLRAFAGEFWQADVLRTVIVADLKAAGTELPAQFPGAWTIRAAELDLGSATLRRAGRR